VQLGGGGWTQLRLVVSLRQPAEARQGASAHARPDPQEIRIFLHGLDRDDLPWGRKTRLALKFELVTMLRSGELLGARRDELFDLDGDNPRFDVPLCCGRTTGAASAGMPAQQMSFLAAELDFGRFSPRMREHSPCGARYGLEFLYGLGV